jgi:serine/threonine-protein kinase
LCRCDVEAPSARKDDVPTSDVSHILSAVVAQPPEPEHLREETVVALVDGALEGVALSAVEAHLGACAACRALLADAAYGAMSGAVDESHVATAPAAPSGGGQEVILEAGTLVGGRYHIEACLGRGGMGAVYAARHVELGHRVAVKVLFHRAEAAVARFLREARTCARLKSEHVASVHDAGRLPDGTPYLAMELLAGADLAHAIATGAVKVSDAVDYVLQACEGLAAAHAAGIVHRDVKPANLFLTKAADGTPLVKVIDFGVAKLLLDDAGGADAGLTSTLTVLGSPLYMSPEHIRRAKDVDERTDVWALGVVLYEMLTGQVPFRAANFATLSIAIATEQPRPPSQLQSGVPRALDACVLRCLEKDRARRFSDLGELAGALCELGGAGGRARAERVERILAGRGSSWALAPAPARRRAALAASVSAFAVIGALGAAWLGLRRGGEQRPARGDAVPAASSPAVVAAPAEPLAPPASARTSGASAAVATARGSASGVPAAAASASSRPPRSAVPRPAASVSADAPAARPSGASETPD